MMQLSFSRKRKPRSASRRCYRSLRFERCVERVLFTAANDSVQDETVSKDDETPAIVSNGNVTGNNATNSGNAILNNNGNAELRNNLANAIGNGVTPETNQASLPPVDQAQLAQSVLPGEGGFESLSLASSPILLDMDNFTVAQLMGDNLIEAVGVAGWLGENLPEDSSGSLHPDGGSRELDSTDSWAITASGLVDTTAFDLNFSSIISSVRAVVDANGGADAIKIADDGDFGFRTHVTILPQFDKGIGFAFSSPDQDLGMMPTSGDDVYATIRTPSSKLVIATGNSSRINDITPSSDPSYVMAGEGEVTRLSVSTASERIAEDPLPSVYLAVAPVQRTGRLVGPSNAQSHSVVANTSSRRPITSKPTVAWNLQVTPVGNVSSPLQVTEAVVLASYTPSTENGLAPDSPNNPVYQESVRGSGPAAPVEDTSTLQNNDTFTLQNFDRDDSQIAAKPSRHYAIASPLTVAVVGSLFVVDRWRRLQNPRTMQTMTRWGQTIRQGFRRRMAR